MEKNKYALKEEEILEFWNKNKIFDRSISSRPEEDPYVFYDGPPFATGLPHYGHILSSVTKDLFPRYWTMKGKRVRRRWGWDCHGLPIETLVEKELGISGKKQIEEKGVEVFNSTARDMVLGYAKDWKRMVERIGRWVEFDNSYKTMDSTYMESVWWALKQAWDKGLIYEGRKVLMYCPRCETPVSNAEIQMDNSYKDIKEESVTVKFRLLPNQKFGSYETKEKVFVLAWTTTPWTLPGNVALAVGKDINYSALRLSGTDELLILASDLIEANFSGKEYEVVHNDIKGSDLEGLQYEPLYEIDAVNNSGNKAWYVALADFVTTEDGTGVVHTAVIYGEDDFALGLELDLPQVPLLDSAGKYNLEAPEFLQGKFIKSAEADINKDLEERGLIFSRAQYLHSYPHCWRCESPLIYNAISAWFINIQKIKDRLIELNQKISWYPDYLKNGRFLNILETAPDWNISRNRYWATALPFFKCEKCNETVCIGSVSELKEKAKNFSEVYTSDKVTEIDLHRPYIDEIILECQSCQASMKRIPEVIDCWVESGSMPFAEWHYPFENKAEFEKRLPSQFVGEYIAQTRAWFYYMHVVSTLLFDEISFENVVATGTILSEKGEKLSKSKKNYPDPWEVIDRYGTDALRFYLMNSVVMQADNLFFNEKDLRETYNKVINILYNVLSFYGIYKEDIKAVPLEEADLKLIDKFIISRLETTKKNSFKHLNGYNTVKYCREIRAFIDDLSLWWLRRSRERFREEGGDAVSAMSTLVYVLRELSALIAPVTPFIAEVIWQEVKIDQDEDSIHLVLLIEPNTALIDKNIELSMAKAREIVEMGHSIRSQVGLKVRQPLSKINFNFDFKELKEDILEIILPELNVEEFSENIKKPILRENQDLTVTLETELDDRLLGLGDLREVTRLIQDIRKKGGLKPSDLAHINYFGDQDASDFILNNLDGIKKATNLAELVLSEGEGFTPLEISSGMLYFKLCEKS
jgi:isoleucyl-tRNA synthetase